MGSCATDLANGLMRAVLLPGMDGTGELLAEFAVALAPEFEATVVPYPRDAALDYAALTEFAAERMPRDEPFPVSYTHLTLPTNSLV